MRGYAFSCEGLVSAMGVRAFAWVFAAAGVLGVTAFGAVPAAHAGGGSVLLQEFMYASKSSVSPGGVVDVSFTVRNMDGLSSHTGVYQITPSFPLRIVSFPAGCSRAGYSVVCRVPVAPLQMVKRTLRVQAHEGALRSGWFSVRGANTVSIFVTR